jgi:hypothetical protein
MPHVVTCESCKRQLAIPDGGQHTHLTCPRCLAELRPSGIRVAPAETPAAIAPGRTDGMGSELTAVDVPDVEKECRKDQRASIWALVLFTLLGVAGLVSLGLLLFPCAAVHVEKGQRNWDLYRASKIAGLVGLFYLVAVLAVIGCITLSRQRKQEEAPSAGTTVFRTLAFSGYMIWSVAGLVVSIALLFVAPVYPISAVGSVIVLVIWFKMSEGYLRTRFPATMSGDLFSRILIALGIALAITVAAGILVFTACTAGIILPPS